MSTNKERRKWALEFIAEQLRSDIPLPAEFDETEGCKRQEAILEIADQLEAKARRIHVEDN